MMKENTPQPAGRFAQARARYGRSTVVQLLIFVGIEAAVGLLAAGVGFLFFGVHWNTSNILNVKQALLSLAASITLIFLHRRVTFRSADRIVWTALPQIGLILLSNLLRRIMWSFIASDAQGPLNYFFLGSMDSEWIAAVLLVSLVYIVLTSLCSFVRAGTICLARKKRKRALCILPLLAMLLLALTNVPVSMFFNAAITGMTMNGLTVLFLLLSFLVSAINGLFEFLAQRRMIYRDTCDTTPAVRRDILRRWQEAQDARPKPVSAVPVQAAQVASAKVRVTAQGETASGKFRVEAAPHTHDEHA